jgi:hypothetical protein
MIKHHLQAASDFGQKANWAKCSWTEEKYNTGRNKTIKSVFCN